MMNMTDESGEKCPFDLNFDPDTFKTGDLVSYRVEGMMDMPFVGVITEVLEDHILLAHYDGNPTPAGPSMRGSRTDRPRVSEADAV
jgi:hypothetical protein